MKIIDCHVHPSAVKNYAEELERLLSHMRAHGISGMIASDLGDGWMAYPDMETLRRANDRIRDMCIKHAGELFYLVYINPQLQNWREELARHEKSACGIKLWISLRNPEDRSDLSAALEVIKAAAERDLPVLIHCFERTSGDAGGSVGIDEMITFAGKVPTCRLIAAHSNGNWRKLIAGADRVPENIFFDISGSYPERTMVRRLVDTFGSERILYGSDAPGRSFGSQLSKVFSAGLLPEEEENVLCNNCRRIFKLPEVNTIYKKALSAFDMQDFDSDNFCFAGKSPYWDHEVSAGDLAAQALKHNIKTIYAASLTAVKCENFLIENSCWLTETAAYKAIKPLAAVDLRDKAQTFSQLENISGFSGVWVSPYLHNWCLSDHAFDWFWQECLNRKINIWINTALSDDRFRCSKLDTRLVGSDEIKRFAASAPLNKYVIQGAGGLADLSRSLPENFFLEYSKLSDGEYLPGEFFAGNAGCSARLCRGSEYPFREFDEVDKVLRGDI